MIYTYNELLLKYKSAYQIEKAVKNGEVYKYEKLKSENSKFSCKNEKDKELMLKMLTKEELETNEKERDLINEIHYYKIGLLSGVFTINDFQKWLDETFMHSDERVLLNLEECKNINEIISCINSYFYNINYDRNPKVALKALMKIIESKYNSKQWSLKQTLDCFGDIYSELQNDGEWWQEEPYTLIGAVSDIFYCKCADDEEIIKEVKRVFEYFK